MVARSIAAMLLTLILCSPASFAEEREWSTEQTISNGEQVTLSWVGAYEGRDTVFELTFPERQDAPTGLKVVGQPVFSPSSRFAAFPNCADDGCQTEVSIVDLEARTVIKAIKVPYEGQIYVTCLWVGDTLEVSVTAPSTDSPKGNTHIHRHSFPGSS